MQLPQRCQNRILGAATLVAALVLAFLTLGAALSGGPALRVIAWVSALTMAVLAGLWLRTFRHLERKATNRIPDMPRIEELPASAMKREPLGMPPARIGFQGVHALVVEDDPVSQQIALGQLGALGITVEVAADGLSALQVLEQRQYDVILMDCQLPGIEGYEVTRRLRCQEGLNRGTPVIAITANTQKGQRERCLAAGMDQYLPKPLNFEILSGLLRRLLTEEAVMRDSRRMRRMTETSPAEAGA